MTLERHGVGRTNPTHQNFVYPPGETNERTSAPSAHAHALAPAETCTFPNGSGIPNGSGSFEYTVSSYYGMTSSLMVPPLTRSTHHASKQKATTFSNVVADRSTVWSRLIAPLEDHKLSPTRRDATRRGTIALQTNTVTGPDIATRPPRNSFRCVGITDADRRPVND